MEYAYKSCVNKICYSDFGLRLCSSVYNQSLCTTEECLFIANCTIHLQKQSRGGSMKTFMHLNRLCRCSCTQNKVCFELHFRYLKCKEKFNLIFKIHSMLAHSISLQSPTCSPTTSTMQ